MRISNQELIKELSSGVAAGIARAKQLQQIDLNTLNFRASETSWSVLQCLEHLNLYGDYYLPAIEASIGQNKRTNDHVFKPGVLGNYFANLMRGNNGKIKMMKSPQDKAPLFTELGMVTIERFIKQQEKLQQLLFLATDTDLTKTTTPISISKWIRLRLGDTFRFLIYHQERHLRQAERVFAQAKLTVTA